MGSYHRCVGGAGVFYLAVNEGDREERVGGFFLLFFCLNMANLMPGESESSSRAKAFFFGGRSQKQKDNRSEVALRPTPGRCHLG